MIPATRSFWISCFLVIGVFAVARFGAFPAIGFTLDDWALLNRAESMEHAGPLMAEALRHPARPFGSMMLMATYRVYGEQIGFYVADILIGFSLFLGLGMWVAFRLTGSRRAALLFGLLGAWWPGYHELFYWPNIMRSGHRLPFFMLAVVAWIRFLDTRRRRYYLAALLLYGWLLFSYEIFLPLPAALAVLIPWNRNWFRQAVRWMVPFGGVVAFYFAWRFTYGFGFGKNILGTDQAFTSAYAANLWELRHNVVSVLSWFVGPGFGRIVLNGWVGLRHIGPAAGLALFALNLILAGWAWRRFRLPETEEPSSFRPLQVAAFGLMLAAGPALILTTTGPAGRTLFFVAIGLFFAICPLARLPWRHTSWLVPVLALGMLSTQGMGKNWEVGAEIQRQLRAHLVQHRPEWTGADILLMDTTSLRERMAPSPIHPPQKNVYAVVEYQGAGFLRGFGPSRLAARVAGAGTLMPRVLLDVECGAEIADGVLHWHDRFNPSSRHATPLDQVYVLDVLSAARIPPHRPGGIEPAE